MSYYIVPVEGPIRSLHLTGEPIDTPQLLKQLGLEFLQIAFSTENVNTPFDWHPEEDETQIQIVDKYSFKLEQVDHMPAIVANRGPHAWGNVGGIHQRQEVNFRTNKETSTDLIQGTVTFNCFSKEGLEAEHIAGNVFDLFRVFRIPLRKSGLFRIDSVAMGEEALTKATSRPSVSVVPVQIQGAVQVRWSIQPRANLLRDVVATIGNVRNVMGSFNP